MYEFQIQSACIKAKKMNFWSQFRANSSLLSRPSVQEDKNIELKSVQRCYEGMDINPNCTTKKFRIIHVQRKKIKELYCENEKKKKKLKRLQSHAPWQRNRRINVKDDIKNLCESSSEAAVTLKSINRGIQVCSSSSADEKRRAEIIRSLQTLDDLNKELQSMGFPLSRRSTYKIILSQRANTTNTKHGVDSIVDDMESLEDATCIYKTSGDEISLTKVQF
ncbi:unnamed protein product [Lepeophtheirus salmonis]|uniref:(salmon louse) hypothetical protein n=1 Tax=Lepeophtheirus salmonis TaxID=72036 RepID=A0A7R8CJL3_LEPSM|nr:unnamed protein product [Lepeophtheirus salmonis]CAF2842844.1 unnamed protein product [Lepeophtheirus salmonis]